MSNNRELGRPTKYNEDMQQLADSYVYDWESIGDKIPSRVGLCRFIGINKTTSYEWAKVHPDFSNTLGVIETLQEYVALNKGVTGEFNSTIVKLIMANFGYSDSSKIDHRSSDGSMSPKGKSLDDFYDEDECTD